MDLTASSHFIRSSALALLSCAQIILLSVIQSRLFPEERLLSMTRLAMWNLKIIMNYLMTCNISQCALNTLIDFYLLWFLGWSSWNPPLPLSGQCTALLQTGDSGAMRDHGCAQRILFLSQPVWGGTSVQNSEGGGQSGRRHTRPLSRGHPLYW